MNKKKEKPETIKNGKFISTWKDGSFLGEEKMVPRWLVAIICIGVSFLIATTALVIIRSNSKKVVAKERVVINIESVKETSLLEVLSISTKEVITESKDDNKDKIEAWTEFSGKGVFVVDLAKSQFIVDDARNTVVVRTPKVVFDTDRFTIEYGKTKNLFFYNAGFNDNYLDGSELFNKQLREAYIKIFNKIYTNPYYYGRAESAAEKIIKSMIEGFNSEVEGLQVYVEIGVL